VKESCLIEFNPGVDQDAQIEVAEVCMCRQFRWGVVSRMDSANEGRTLILRSALGTMIEQGSIA
jgi:hypothetical protein